jgi:hypothetical protein
VVVCEGTGRAADLLAYIHKQTEEGGWVYQCKGFKNLSKEAFGF